jgi:hypothetical protein
MEENTKDEGDDDSENYDNHVRPQLHLYIHLLRMAVSSSAGQYLYSIHLASFDNRCISKMPCTSSLDIAVVFSILSCNIKILQRAKIIACTTSRAARDIEILKRVSPKIILLEEAAEIPEHHVVSCLTSSCQQLIMIGDHLQLRPAYNDYETARQYKRHFCNAHELSHSFFHVPGFPFAMELEIS